MIKLEICKEEDYHFIYQLVKDFFKKNLNVTYLKLETFEEFVKRAFITNDKYFIVKNNMDDKLGFVHIMNNNEIGYFIDPKIQGRGIGTEAVRQLMELNPRERYFAIIHNENKASIRLVEKLGFLPKGTIFEKKLVKEV